MLAAARACSRYGRARVTQQKGACKAESADVAAATASISNTAGALLLRSPVGPVAGRPQGRVAGSLRAAGTRPHPPLALGPASHRRVPSPTVKRPSPVLARPPWQAC